MQTCTLNVQMRPYQTLNLRNRLKAPLKTWGSYPSTSICNGSRQGRAYSKPSLLQPQSCTHGADVWAARAMARTGHARTGPGGARARARQARRKGNEQGLWRRKWAKWGLTFMAFTSLCSTPSKGSRWNWFFSLQNTENTKLATQMLATHSALHACKRAHVQH